MSVKHDYLKNVAVVPTAGSLTNNAFVINLDNLVTTDNQDTLAVYYNGQMLQEYKTGVVNNFAKYYYTFTNNNSAWVNTPITGIESSCSITITVFANQDFITSGYTNADAIQIANFSETDVFFISYYYSVMKDV